MERIDWNKPLTVKERGVTVATIVKNGDRYTVTNHDERVSSGVDNFKDAAVMRKWLSWAYPKADALMQGDALVRSVG